MNSQLTTEKHQITGALFDCDGTLLDSIDAWQSLEEDLALKAGATIDAEEHRLLASFTIPECARYFHERYGLAQSTQAVVQLIDDYMMNYYSTQAALLPGVAELLESCARSDVRLAVTSSSTPAYLEAGLSCAGIREYFKQVISVDDVGASKREPVIFNYACDLLGTNRETTWGFEDSIYAMEALRAAGFSVVGIYAPTTAKEVKQVADIAISSWEDILVVNGCIQQRPTPKTACKA